MIYYLKRKKRESENSSRERCGCMKVTGIHVTFTLEPLTGFGEIELMGWKIKRVRSVLMKLVLQVFWLIFTKTCLLLPPQTKLMSLWRPPLRLS